ncbi:MAG: EAL domain-containing protein [Terracidiphilus sp.]
MKKRILFTLAATIVAAGCGTLGGFLLASAITVRVTEIRLDQYASRIVADWEASSAELRTALAAMSASQYRVCSADEIGYFRALIFESDFLKDAGRMRDGRIECSAALGKVANPRAQPYPDFTQQDGTEIYKSLGPYRNSDLTTIALKQGDYYVVFTPLTRMHPEPAPMHYAETAIDAPTQRPGPLLGEPSLAGSSILTKEGIVRQGESLFATQCSIRFFNCVTAYASIPEELQANRDKFTGCIVLCGLLGGFGGLVLSFLYRRNKSIEQQLRRSIRRGELCVVYQPIVHLASGRIAGAEALARWTDEEGIPVGPDVFVKVAEAQGFVGEITELVVRHALKEFAETLRSLPDFRVSVNVTAADLSDPKFLPMLDQALKRAAVPARSVAIEITESSTARRETAIETILRLRQRGHSVHIDDFGTGYSSLAYLHELSVDAIKIDKAFTQAIGTGAVIVDILPQILAMAQTLNLAVIVEGVETELQADYLAATGLPILAQGWLFGHPVPACEFHCLLGKDGKKEPVVAGVARVTAERLLHTA